MQNTKTTGNMSRGLALQPGTLQTRAHTSGFCIVTAVSPWSRSVHSSGFYFYYYYYLVIWTSRGPCLFN